MAATYRRQQHVRTARNVRNVALSAPERAGGAVRDCGVGGATRLGWAPKIGARIGAWFGVPTGIRTPVTAVKGRCPRPLDDGDCGLQQGWLVEVTGIEPVTSCMPCK